MTPALHLIRNYLLENSGISLGVDKEYLFRARLEPLLQTFGLKNLEELAERLRTTSSSALRSAVISAMTTNETLWFRDCKPFEQIKSFILPEIISQKAHDRRISIWCAACSTGQEAYSVAMTLSDEEEKLRGWNIEILASDISDPALERAKEGRYSHFEVQRGLPIHRLAKDFDACGVGEWRIKPRLRSMIQFQKINLLEPPRSIGSFDLVLLRNVLIYFDIATKSRVLRSIADHARPGAFLLLGGAETTLGISTAFHPVPGHGGVYRH